MYKSAIISAVVIKLLYTFFPIAILILPWCLKFSAFDNERELDIANGLNQDSLALIDIHFSIDTNLWVTSWDLNKPIHEWEEYGLIAVHAE